MRPQPQWAALDVYASNSDLYADPRLVERVDYRRRFKRHRPRTRTVVLAPHGGGIEIGTSELCLAIAGYHPSTRVPIGQTHDYWMFEGLRSVANDELHVTSSNCDDRVARDLVSGATHALGLHGCTAAAAGLEDHDRAVLVGNGAAATPCCAWSCSPGCAAPGSTPSTPSTTRYWAATTARTSPTAPAPSRAASWSSPRRCGAPCSPRTPAPTASTPPPRSSGTSCTPAAPPWPPVKPSTTNPPRV